MNRLDALIPAMSEQWRTVTRSDVMRAAIAEGLPILEARYGGRP